MTHIKRFISLFIIIMICPTVFGAVGMTPSEGTPSCGAIQDGQDLCGTGPATFESNAIGVCPEGTFTDIGRWGCYTCPEGFDRGIAAVDSDRACTRTRTDEQLERFNSAKNVGSACPKGSFLDPAREGECWSCPSGYVRSIAHIDWADACVVLAEEVFKKATEHSSGTGILGTDCPPQIIDLDNFPNLTPKQFWDAIDGKCHSCPTGYARTGYSIHDSQSRACSKLILAEHSRATRQGQAKCGDSEITDFLINPEQGGNCYACPADYDRTAFHIDGPEACETTPEIEFSSASKTADLTCPANQIFDFISTNHPDVQKKLLADDVPRDAYTSDDLGTCWSCPPGGTRSWSSVTASDACVLAELGWNMPTYNHVGLFGLKSATSVVLDIINEKDDIVKLAEGFTASLTDPSDDELTKDAFTQEVWQEISQNPEQSSLLAIAALARLQTYANTSDLKQYEREFLDDFQQQVTDYRSAMALEALNILKVWQDGAFLRYIDPRFNVLPEVVLQKLFWLSIGVVSPPVSPPDFSALIYEYEDTPTVDPVVLGMTAAERSIDHGIMITLFPNDLVGDLASNVKDKLTDELLSRAEEEIMDQIEKQIQKKAFKSGAKVTAKMMLVGPSTLGPQIAVSLFIEYATQWTDFVAGSIDAEPKLKANLAQAQQTYSVSRKLATEEGGLDLRHHYKTIMNSSVLPSSLDKLKIEQAVAAHGDFTLGFSASSGGSVDTNTLPVDYDGTSSAVTAIPDKGYSFTHWTDSTGLEVSVSPTLTISNASASETYTAHFSINNDSISINGDCGSSHETPVTVAPSANLCGAGTAGSVTGSGPWMWSCNGSNQGGNVSCSAVLLDTVAPEVKAPLSINLAATSQNGTSASDTAILTFLASATASDNVDGVVPVTHDGPATFSFGLTVVTFNATDNAGNIGSAQAIITVIDGPPVVVPPSDMSLDASALLTNIALGTATATDALDGVLTATASKTGPFTSGRHSIVWSATDSKGNIGEATQTLRIRPLANFTYDRIADNKAGTPIEVNVFLNGAAADYPVTIPFTVGGTASNPAEHDLFAGNIVINSGNTGSITFNLADNGTDTNGNTIILSMGTPSNAAMGIWNTHIITLSELNEAPQVTLTLYQNGLATNSIATTENGNIVATVNVGNPNTSGNYSYDWAKSHALLTDLDATDNTFSFDPSLLNPGVYQLAVSVTDTANAALSSSAVISVSIQASEPALSNTTDSDGDGQDDASEGYGDADKDGIPDYLDAIAELNVLNAKRGNSHAFLIETNSGLHLRLGSVAIGSDSSQVSSSEVESLSQSPADTATNIGGIFDYEVSNLPTTGQTIEVVIPQIAAVPSDSIYRQLMDGSWLGFIENGTDKISSTEGTEGYCPPPLNGVYTEGLTPGHWCVQLTIADGGPNDADGEANNRVINLGGVSSLEPVVEKKRKKKRSGAVSLWMLSLLSILALRFKRREHEA